MTFITVMVRHTDGTVGEVCLNFSSVSCFYDQPDDSCTHIFLLDGQELVTTSKLGSRLREFISKSTKITRI